MKMEKLVGEDGDHYCTQMDELTHPVTRIRTLYTDVHTQDKCPTHHWSD